MTDRKPIFDAVRLMLGRGFTDAEVGALDRAIDRAEGKAPPVAAARLGALSAQYESGGRGPGTVSGGVGDPGGVSYGTYQLASKTNTARLFTETEGARWPELRSASPGSVSFSNMWRAIAADEPEAFDAAQHAFIERTHYRPTVAAVLKLTGVDLDKRSQAVRDATWSLAVQHGGASKILAAALAKAGDGASDADLLRAIYAERTRYVQAIADRSTGATRKTLQSVVDNRYPSELKNALAMLGG